MKKTLLLVSLLASTGMFAQTFSDNFDSYTAGGLVAQQSAGAWTTWSNAPGGAEDVTVSSADAMSAPNSLYLSSTASTGGPDDLMKYFNATPLVSGNFNLKMDMKVEAGKAAYFNLQGTNTPGGLYALDVYFKDNGTLSMSNASGGEMLNVAYPNGAWFSFEMDINLTLNNWNVKINGTSVGIFFNTENKVASIDIFPVDSDAPISAGFYVDNFEYTVTPYVPAAFDAAITLVNNVGAEIATLTNGATATVRNVGNTVITAYTINYTYNFITIPQVITGQNLALLASATHTAPSNILLIAGSNPLVATLVSINGLALDDVALNNSKTLMINPIVPAFGKVVVGEEATGTWCQYCPRGAVFMDQFSTNYSNLFAGIAVHNGDPMTETSYDAGMGALVSGYPSMLVDRGAASDPSSKDPEILAHLLVAPKGTHQIGAIYTSATRELKVSVTTTFNTAVATAYKLALVLTEDGVTGTASGYNQSNAFAGGATVMGGFELLPNPVPAAQMVYDHVARVIQPSFAGAAVFGASVASGAVFTNTYTITLPATWDENSIHIVPMLIASDGKIDNAGKNTIAEAVANGYVAGLETEITTVLDGPDAILNISPNPTSGDVKFTINQGVENSGIIAVYDANGKMVHTATVVGNNAVSFDTSKLQAGVYVVDFNQGKTKISKRMIVK
jgi:hypothetical protein